MLLKLILKKSVSERGMDMCSLGQGQEVGSCEHANRTLGSI